MRWLECVLKAFEFGVTVTFRALRKKSEQTRHCLSLGARRHGGRQTSRSTVAMRESSRLRESTPMLEK